MEKKNPNSAESAWDAFIDYILDELQEGGYI